MGSEKVMVEVGAAAATAAAQTLYVPLAAAFTSNVDDQEIVLGPALVTSLFRSHPRQHSRWDEEIAFPAPCCAYSQFLTTKKYKTEWAQEGHEAAAAANARH